MKNLILISARKNLRNDDEVAGKVKYRNIKLDQNGMPKGGPSRIMPIDLHAQTQGKNILLLVHGYNNRLQKLCNSYSLIRKEIASKTSEYDMVIGFAWPGGGHKVDYMEAKERADESGNLLSHALRHLQPGKLDLMTHSLGARVGLIALDRLHRPNSSPIVRNHFCTAAAVDDDNIQKGEKFYKATKMAEKMYLFHSKFDPVLEKAYPAGERASKGANIFKKDTALGLTGPDPLLPIIKHSPHVKIVNCNSLISSHGGYKRAPKFYSFLANVLNGNHSPMDQFFQL
tara:strand:- start:4319 stop:5176 length:858 start_codon:yes stop_codon:yes gene_type:complete